MFRMESARVLAKDTNLDWNMQIAITADIGYSRNQQMNRRSGQTTTSILAFGSITSSTVKGIGNRMSNTKMRENIILEHIDSASVDSRNVMCILQISVIYRKLKVILHREDVKTSLIISDSVEMNRDKMIKRDIVNAIAMWL